MTSVNFDADYKRRSYYLVELGLADLVTPESRDEVLAHPLWLTEEVGAPAEATTHLHSNYSDIRQAFVVIYRMCKHLGRSTLPDQFHLYDLDNGVEYDLNTFAVSVQPVAADDQKADLVVVVEGGIVQAILARTPLTAVLVDYDDKAEDPDDRCFAHCFGVEPLERMSQEVKKLVQEALTAEEEA